MECWWSGRGFIAVIGYLSLLVTSDGVDKRLSVIGYLW
jgi:hypothetical protein